MYIPKRYGESKVEKCPFCEKQGLVKNNQGLVVCTAHKETGIPEVKCVCGSYLDMKEGKFGPYFNCINCGNINLKKGLEMLTSMQEKKKIPVESGKKGIVSDEGKYPGFDYGVD
jgi:hypothetical protein